ncbi:MAG: hypothetical protein AAGM27_02520 [Cyanobacteria bacterium J06554_3]
MVTFVKYFFLSETWTTGRIWEFGGLWNELAWNRPPYVKRQPLYIQENGDNLWLYQAEDAILMIEVMPKAASVPTIGQVVLKRLLSAEQVVDRLCLETVFHPSDSQTQDTNENEIDEANTTEIAASDNITHGNITHSNQPVPKQPSASHHSEKSTRPSALARLRQLATGRLIKMPGSSASATATLTANAATPTPTPTPTRPDPASSTEA